MRILLAFSQRIKHRQLIQLLNKVSSNVATQLKPNPPPGSDPAIIQISGMRFSGGDGPYLFRIVSTKQAADGQEWEIRSDWATLEGPESHALLRGELTWQLRNPRVEIEHSLQHFRDLTDRRPVHPTPEPQRMSQTAPAFEPVPMPLLGQRQPMYEEPSRGFYPAPASNFNPQYLQHPRGPAPPPAPILRSDLAFYMRNQSPPPPPGGPIIPQPPVSGPPLSAAEAFHWQLSGLPRAPAPHLNPAVMPFQPGPSSPQPPSPPPMSPVGKPVVRFPM